MHHDNYHSNNHIVPPLINFLLSYVTLIHYGLISHKIVHVDGIDGSTSWIENFLMVFGMPTLLWRVLHFVGYHEQPLYHWNEEYLEGQPWYEVRLTIPARTQAPFWQEWKAESEGKTPWEAAQVVAFEVLSEICQQHGDALTGSAASMFPRVDPSTTIWE